MAGSAVGEGGRCSCGGSGVPPALRSPDDPPHPCAPSKAPGFPGKLSSCQGDLDGAWMKHTETRRNQDVATGASRKFPLASVHVVVSGLRGRGSMDPGATIPSHW